MSVERKPGFCPFDKLERHGERDLVRQAALRAGRSTTRGCEGAFNQGPQALPMFGRKIIERLMRRDLFEVADGFVVLGLVEFDEVIEGHLGVVPSFVEPELREFLRTINRLSPLTVCRTE